MKKILGTICCCIGGLFAALSAAGLAYKIHLEFPYGFFGQNLTVIAILAAVLAGSVLVIVFGWWLRRAKPRAPKVRPSFAQQERRSEQENQARTRAVPSRGVYIWKYQGKTSGGRGYALRSAGAVLGLVVLACVFCMGMVALFARTGRSQGALWLSTGLIVAMTVGISLLAVHVGQISGSRKYAFARDEAGRLFLFNYGAPAFRAYGKPARGVITGTSALGGAVGLAAWLIGSAGTGRLLRRIDEAEVIERIMRDGAADRYGRQIVAVKSITPAGRACRVYCTLRRPDGAEQHTSFVLARSYHEFDALVEQLERLK